jgi:hypothetical protein
LYVVQLLAGFIARPEMNALLRVCNSSTPSPCTYPAGSKTIDLAFDNSFYTGMQGPDPVASCTMLQLQQLRPSAQLHHESAALFCCSDAETFLPLAGSLQAADTALAGNNQCLQFFCVNHSKDITVTAGLPACADCRCLDRQGSQWYSFHQHHPATANRHLPLLLPRQLE